MRILITNNTFDLRAGTELFCRDIGLALIKRGHQVALYSSHVGNSGTDFKKLGLRVISDLEELDFEPELIHGQHHLDAMTAMLRFPKVPALLVCHGAKDWLEEPIRFPSVQRYVAVDDPTHDRLQQSGIPPDSIDILRTAVDLERFPLRENWSSRPQRALVFSNYLWRESDLRVFREGCRLAGIDTLQVIGVGLGAEKQAPEKLLAQYDIVFAKGRAAHEAAATGAAVILTDCDKIAGMLTTKNYEEWRRLNLGFKTLTQTATAKTLQRAIKDYDVSNVKMVAQRLRLECSIEQATDELIGIYDKVLSTGKKRIPIISEIEFQRAASAYQRMLTQYLKKHKMTVPAERFIWGIIRKIYAELRQLLSRK